MNEKRKEELLEMLSLIRNYDEWFDYTPTVKKLTTIVHYCDSGVRNTLRDLRKLGLIKYAIENPSPVKHKDYKVTEKGQEWLNQDSSVEVG